MLAIQSSKPQKCTPNLLPARIDHNGSINDADRYWKTEKDDNGKSHAYFRGRHLHGTPLPLPCNYTGAVLHITENELPQSQTNNDRMVDDEEEQEEEEVERVTVKVAQKVGEFDEVVVWGHGGEVDKALDVFVRGAEEWMGFAEAMHVDEEREENGEGKSAG